MELNYSSFSPSTSNYIFRSVYTHEIEQSIQGIDEVNLPETPISLKLEMNLSDNIYNLALLKEGWDFGIGEKISNEVIKLAIQIHNHVAPHGFDCEVHPTVSGGINLIYASSDTFIDVSIDSDLTINLTKEKGIGFDYDILFEKENVDEKEVIKELNLMSIEKFVKCSLSEPSILENTVQVKKDLQATPLKATKVEFPFLIWNVPRKKLLMGSANTFQFFTIPQLAIQ